MKNYLIILVFFLITVAFAEPNMNNKTPVPTIKAGQESGLYEGVNNNPTMTHKQRHNKKKSEERIDLLPGERKADPIDEHQRVPLVPNP